MVTWWCIYQLVKIGCEIIVKWVIFDRTIVFIKIKAIFIVETKADVTKYVSNLKDSLKAWLVFMVFYKEICKNWYSMHSA